MGKGIVRVVDKAFGEGVRMPLTYEDWHTKLLLPESYCVVRTSVKVLPRMAETFSGREFEFSRITLEYQVEVESSEIEGDHSEVTPFYVLDISGDAQSRRLLRIEVK